jgi:hypothetical protein
MAFLLADLAFQETLLGEVRCGAIPYAAGNRTAFRRGRRITPLKHDAFFIEFSVSPSNLFMGQSAEAGKLGMLVEDVLDQ